MREIIDYIADIVGHNERIYYSIENNTLGEAGLVTIAEIGEENIRGVFLSEPAKVGNARRFRKGFTTTAKSKLAACSKFKMLLETDRITINSKALLSELKSFVAHGMSFAAKPGEHDDLVMATLLIIRMVQYMQNFDSELDTVLKDSMDDFIEPMPFIMV